MRRIVALLLVALSFAGCMKDPYKGWDEHQNMDNWMLGSWKVVESIFTLDNGQVKEKVCPLTALTFGADGKGKMGSESFTYTYTNRTITISFGEESQSYNVGLMSARQMEITWEAYMGKWWAKLDKTSITK